MRYTVNRFFTFIGGASGRWRVTRLAAVIGDGLPTPRRLEIVNADVKLPPHEAMWLLRGVTSYERYVTQRERDQLVASQPTLDRQEATCAALIPVKKSAAWWELPQDERRAVFETRSSHVATGLKYLPAVARRLHHCYDLAEPFDFLTWFEFAPAHARDFEELVQALRRTEEWRYVEREIDVRLVRE
jgi:chlorite dismutase